MRRYTIIINILLAVLSPIIFFGVLEIITRAVWHYKIEDTHTGLVLEGTNRQVQSEVITYKINSKGIRNREIEGKEIVSANKRILALGDSFVWGDGLNEDALITTKIERMLQLQYPGVVVINAGISTYNTEDEYKQLLRLSPIYHPNHILVFFFTNDVLATRTNAAGNRHDESRIQNLKEFLRKRSKFFAFLYHQYKTKYAVKIGVPQYLLPPDYFNLDDSKPGWITFKQSVLKIRDYCLNDFTTLQFIIIPTLTNLDENYPYKELHNKVKEFLNQSSIPFVDLFHTFAHYQPSELWVSPENCHWNNKATSIATEEIVKNLMVNMEK
ncbi:MAG: SGNH/GDSL hydrolase family protein [Candidatus Brocadia sp.]|nr:MAG: SGNH/GDSL hydrolase family protein [Candidatus Brocadia sp.]